MAHNVYGTAAVLNMRRSLMDRKYSHKTSEPFGKMVPIGMPQEVLPGDSWSLTLSNVKRMLTPKAPIMDDIAADIYGFFIPNRIIWDKAKAFFGENDMVAWTLPQNVYIPQLLLGFMGDLTGIFTDQQSLFYNSNSDDEPYLYLVDDASDPNPVVLDSVFRGSIFEYLGLPFVWPNSDVLNQIATLFSGGEDILIGLNSLPFRAIQLVYNEFFRNENVTDPITQFVYDGSDYKISLYEFVKMFWNRVGHPAGTFILDEKFWFLPSVARWKDLFTSCLPAPQRGPSVGLPLLGDAPIKTVANTHLMGTNPLKFEIGSGLISSQWTNMVGYTAVAGNTVFEAKLSAGTAPGTTSPSIYRSNLLADLSSVAMATVNEIRLAFATQRYYEKLARGGARYNEYLQVMFGVRPSDAVLQRPQFLGGKHIHINISQVIATANSTDTDGDIQSLGQTGAYSATGFKGHIFSNSFTEHGLILCFVCNRKEHTYCQGLDKIWTKTDVFDIYNPTFAHIGEVPVMKNEVYWQPGNTQVLGYNEAWLDYRAQRSVVSGLLNPLHAQSLGYYVLTDVFDSAPTLTDEFIFEDPNGLDRALVASALVTDQFISDYYFEYKVARVMPVRSIPGLIDHY